MNYVVVKLFKDHKANKWAFDTHKVSSWLAMAEDFDFTPFHHVLAHKLQPITMGVFPEGKRPNITIGDMTAMVVGRVIANRMLGHDFENDTLPIIEHEDVVEIHDVIKEALKPFSNLFAAE